jgi:hypothetical protein
LWVANSNYTSDVSVGYVTRIFPIPIFNFQFQFAIFVVLGGMGEKGPNDKRAQQQGASCQVILLRRKLPTDHAET